MLQNHSEHINFIWTVANLLRGPYRPPQYRKVMLPMTVLKRLDSVLEPTKDKVIAKYEEIKNKDYPQDAIDRILEKAAGHKFYNTSPLTFSKMVAAHENIAQDFKNYIKSFSPNAQNIIERFKFEGEIEKLDEANRLFKVMKEFAKIDLSPAKVSNLEMGYIFEELIRKFNEQANEEAGDYFTPREVIRLMTHSLYAYDDDFFNKEGLVVKIYDPTCGTGGMLSISEEYIHEHSEGINIGLFGQEYNDESWAICAADMLIKGENPENIKYGDTLGDGKTEDKFPDETFHYMLANPPYGVEWKPEEDEVKKEYDKKGFDGRFGAGLPPINDGSLLFLQHMISKMEQPPEEGGRGSRIGIVFNGSPLFSGDAGSGPSNIRRWVIENDWLETIIAMPDQLFYNTGIYTYIWIVTNRKEAERKGKIQLINAIDYFQKMPKSLGHKRNEISESQIEDITRLYGAFEENEHSKIFDNQEFGYIKLTVERPLRLNFNVSPERIRKLWEETSFQNLAKSKKRKDKEARKKEIEKGEKLQQTIVEALATLDQDHLYIDREKFLTDVDGAMKKADIKLKANIKKAIWKALGEQDQDAEICRDKKGNPEPDTDLRDNENIPLPEGISLPLPYGYDKDSDLSKLLPLIQPLCESYMKEEVLPHVPDAWVDWDKTRIGYEIPMNRHFYEYNPPRELSDIESDIKSIEREIVDSLAEITGSNIS